VLDTEQFRQRLAGLIDQRSEVDAEDFASVAACAIHFVSSLPIVFGEQLERTTLWDKIGAALDTAYAKTAADDCDFFISRVLESILASPAAVARCEAIGQVITWLSAAPTEMRHAWLQYIATHRYAVLVRARMAWEQQKEARANA